MKERFLELVPDAGQKQEERFHLWLSGEGIPFANEAAKAAHQERATLIKDAVQLRKRPSRVPVCPSNGFFPIEYGRISMYEAMYDYDALIGAWEKYYEDFHTDSYNGPGTVVPGKPLDLLGFKLYQWPVSPVSDVQEYQFVEGEYMKAEEYLDLIDDPTAFFLNTYFPRIFGVMEPFGGFPLLPAVNEIVLVPTMVAAFGSDALKGVFNKLHEAGREVLRWRECLGNLGRAIMGKGFPAISGGFTKAPFDVIGDSLRGTRGVMLDMFRHPEELKEACERLTPIMIKYGAAGCRATGHLMPLIPLHKGADGFMSDDQFKTFYWPTLRKLIIGLINEGMVPVLFAEGAYNQRLEVISDIPRGKVIWWFDRTDISRAKETVGRVACIMGNFSVGLLCTATQDEVRFKCRALMETMGAEGGYIFGTGAPMGRARPENVKAMLETVNACNTL